MIHHEPLLSLIPEDIRRKYSGSCVLQCGWAAGPCFIVRTTDDFPQPVSLKQACSILENDRHRFKACHLLLNDRSVLWMKKESFTRHDPDDRELKLSGCWRTTSTGCFSMRIDPIAGTTEVERCDNRMALPDLEARVHSVKWGGGHQKTYTVRFYLGGRFKPEIPFRDPAVFYDFFDRLFEMRLTATESGFTMEPDKDLAECMDIFAREKSVSDLETEHYFMWQAGFLADKIADSIVRSNIMNTWRREEDEEFPA